MRRKRASVSVCHQATKEPCGRHERDQSARPRNARRAKGEREPEAAAATTSASDKLNATGRGRIPQAVTTRTQASPKRNPRGGSPARSAARGFGGGGATVNEQAEPSTTRATALRNPQGANSACPVPTAGRIRAGRARASRHAGWASSEVRTACPSCMAKRRAYPEGLLAQRVVGSRGRGREVVRESSERAGVRGQGSHRQRTRGAPESEGGTKGERCPQARKGSAATGAVAREERSGTLATTRA